MKNPVRKLLVLTVLFSLAVLATGCQDQTPVFQVNDVVSDPGAFTGTIAVVGIVNAFAQSDATVVGIMDKKELQCTTPNCKKVLLPVRISGQRPAIGAEVKVSGSFSQEVWGPLFNAEKTEVLTHHQLGGQG